MMVLRVDGVVCKLRSQRIEFPRFSAKRFEGVQPWRENVDMYVEVVATPEVRALVGYAENMHRVENFNLTRHWGVVVVDGVAMFEGEATVCGVERKAKSLYYRMRLRALGHDWAHNVARTRLRNSAVETSITMTLPGIEATWGEDQPVRMLPLRYDSYPEPEESGLYSAERLWMPHEYYPFMSVVEIIKKMVKDGGYTLHSRFLDTDVAKRLLMSGAYKRVDGSLLRSKMDFKAMRSRSTTAAAGEDGRVYVWEPLLASNIGAIVDTVDPTAVDDQGGVLYGAFANGGCFSFDEGRPIFTPTREVRVAFDYHLHYTTEYQIASSRYLKGFTQLHLGNGCDVEVTLHNPFVDMRNSVNSNMIYKLFIFDYDPSCSYMVEGYGEVSERVSSVLFEDGHSGSVRLMVREADASDYVEYEGDWAIYEGYVSESGTREVVVDVRTPVEKLTPSSPKRFNDIYIGGACEGQQMTLHARCSVTPVFSGSAGYGEKLKFPDIANVDISQAELLEAVAQMFNLRFYSHEPTKSLYIEPYDDFFDGEVVDWRDRQHGDGEIVSECVVDSFERTILGYQPADGATARYTYGEVSELGTWDYHVENYAVKRSVEHLLNPLFRPIATFTGASATAPSAEVLTAGDRDVVTEYDSLDPRVVVYHGVEALNEGEYWPSPNGDKGFPMAAFHSLKHNATLCFDDREGCSGLHHYYDNELKERALRQRLECDIYLAPLEYVALFDPSSEGATVRSNFRLKACGQSGLFRLDSIESYDAKNRVARCCFVRRLRD